MLKPLFALASFYSILKMLDMAQGTNYKDQYIDFILNWWQVLLTLYVLPRLLKFNANYKYKIFDRLRLKQLNAEKRRFKNPNQMSSLITLYLLGPPRSHRAGYGYIANDKFYKKVVEAFHEKLASTTQNRQYYFILDKIRLYFPQIDIFLYLRQAIYLILPFTWILYVKQQLYLSFISDWPVLTIPIILALFLRTMYYIEASIIYSKFELKKKLAANGLNEVTALQDVLPNTKIGYEIQMANKAEAEYRQRCSYLSRDIPIPDKLPQWQHLYFPHEIYPPNLKESISRLKSASKVSDKTFKNTKIEAIESQYASIVSINMK